MEANVTVGICVKNCEATIKEAIDGIVFQNYPHECVEIIVVDNGSQDRTLSVINEIISKTDFPLKIFHAGGKGLGEVRQIVVDNALGRYIIWVDGDIIIPNNYLRKQVEFMEQNQSIGVIIGKMKNCKKGILVSTLECIARSSDYKINFRKTKPQRLATGASLFRVKSLNQVGGFDKNIIGAGEDTEVIFRIQKAGWLIFLSQEEFFNKFRENWRAVLKQQLWYGYGVHYLWHKCKDQVTLWIEIPLTAFMEGLMRSFKAYRELRQKKVFLLSLYNFSKKIAWWFGFFKGHMEGYGHKSKDPRA